MVVDEGHDDGDPLTAETYPMCGCEQSTGATLPPPASATQTPTCQVAEDVAAGLGPEFGDDALLFPLPTAAMTAIAMSAAANHGPLRARIGLPGLSGTGNGATTPSVCDGTGIEDAFTRPKTSVAT